MAVRFMKSTATPRFWQLLHALPKDVQELAEKNYCYGSPIPSIILSDTRGSQGAGTGFRFAWVITTGPLLGNSMTVAWSGFGLAVMRSMINC